MSQCSDDQVLLIAKLSWVRECVVGGGINCGIDNGIKFER